jgi:hypothetical protein
LFDSGFATGLNLQSASENGIDVYAPAGTAPADNPAIRTDPSVPVPEEMRHRLPSQGRKKVLTREAFVYHSEQDCYWCPMGRKLPLYRVLKASGRRAGIKVREYLCTSCEGCALARRCLSRKAKRRRITRDQFEPYREELKARMTGEEARQIYRRRAPAIEGIFGYIKHVMGIRQFLLRGLDKIRTEWLWICAAYNLTRILAGSAPPERSDSSGQSRKEPRPGRIPALRWPKSRPTRRLTVPFAWVPEASGGALTRFWHPSFALAG